MYSTCDDKLTQQLSKKIGLTRFLETAMGEHDWSVLCPIERSFLSMVPNDGYAVFKNDVKVCTVSGDMAYDDVLNLVCG
jgi:hypothetical protein